MERLATDAWLQSELRDTRREAGRAIPLGKDCRGGRRGVLVSRPSAHGMLAPCAANVTGYDFALGRAPEQRRLELRDDANDQIERSEPPDHDDSILGDEVNDPSLMPQPMGVRNALQALNVALHSRMRKELSRFKLDAGRKTA